MNYLKFVLIVVYLGFSTSCQPPVVFGEPQPADTEPLSEIPNDYQGIYWCKVDSASLLVDSRTFIKRREFLIKLTRAELDSSRDLQLKNGRLFVNDWRGSFPIEEKGGTIISKIVIRDTLFSLGKKQLAKPFKGHLILNTRLDEDAWGVTVVSLKDYGLISIAHANMPEDLTGLDAITPVRTLSKNNERKTQIYITPTKDQFDQILHRGVLFEGPCTEFERIIPLKEIGLLIDFIKFR
jgi:hypothetical protein